MRWQHADTYIYIYIYIQPFKIPNSLHPQRFEPMNSWVNLLNSWTMNRWPAPEFSRTVPLLLVMGPWLEDEPILNLGKKMLSRSYPIGFWTCCHRFPEVCCTMHRFNLLQAARQTLYHLLSKLGQQKSHLPGNGSHMFFGRWHSHFCEVPEMRLCQ